MQQYSPQPGHKGGPWEQEVRAGIEAEKETGGTGSSKGRQRQAWCVGTAVPNGGGGEEMGSGRNGRRRTGFGQCTTALTRPGWFTYVVRGVEGADGPRRSGRSWSNSSCWLGCSARGTPSCMLNTPVETTTTTYEYGAHSYIRSTLIGNDGTSLWERQLRNDWLWRVGAANVGCLVAAFEAVGANHRSATIGPKANACKRRRPGEVVAGPGLKTAMLMPTVKNVGRKRLLS